MSFVWPDLYFGIMVLKKLPVLRNISVSGLLNWFRLPDITHVGKAVLFIPISKCTSNGRNPH